MQHLVQEESYMNKDARKRKQEEMKTPMQEKYNPFMPVVDKKNVVILETTLFQIFCEFIILFHKFKIT